MHNAVYSEEQVNNLLQEAISLNAIHTLYNPTVKDGVLHYQLCRPNVHWLKRNTDNKMFKCVATDEAVIVLQDDANLCHVIYAHDLSDYTILTPQLTATSEATVYTDDLPSIGSVHTHKNGNVYLVYGYGNLKANLKNREKYPINIHYIGSNGFTWDKSLAEFKDKMVQGGVFQFNEGVQMEYMGISENEILVNGFMTKEIAALAAHMVATDDTANV